MSNAREIINAACIKVNQWRASTYVSKIMADIEAAGFRILAPDELDPATVERCAQVVEEHDEGHNSKTGERLVVPRNRGSISGLGYAAAIRTLTGGNNGC